ncbi:DNA/RNA non-specific endonuclease [Aromatoleum buckelii]|nr:DNA/RNA non-specific endonuclease [Aromatoleum buckelii]MCK0509734.1 DNA/RNA non-specific endonuclease [Aromatoleum buckelii]
MRTRSVVALAALLLTTTNYAAGNGFRSCPDAFPGPPPVIKRSADWKLRELCYDAFALLHSGKTRTPLFVVEKLTRASLTDADDEERTNRFFADARLPRLERAHLDDYHRSGFDRGHMAPAADMPTAQAMAQSFSLANVVPQAPNNNRRTWAKVERDTRAYVKRSGSTVHVFTGPAWQGHRATIGSSPVAVPTHVYKLVYDATKNRAWAHWLPNTDEARLGRPISYDALTQHLGFELLPGKRPSR